MYKVQTNQASTPFKDLQLPTPKIAFPDEDEEEVGGENDKGDDNEDEDEPTLPAHPSSIRERLSATPPASKRRQFLGLAPAPVLKPTAFSARYVALPPAEDGREKVRSALPSHEEISTRIAATMPSSPPASDSGDTIRNPSRPASPFIEQEDREEEGETNRSGTPPQLQQGEAQNTKEVAQLSSPPNSQEVDNTVSPKQMRRDIQVGGEEKVGI